MGVKKMMLSFGNRLWINRCAITKLACTYTGVIITMWGFVSLFVSGSDLLPEEITIYCKILIGCLVLMGVYVLSTIIATFYILGSTKVSVITSNTKHHVYVQYGDMYTPEIIEKGYAGKRSIVIPVNRCFDTVIDDNLVTLNSQHGKVFQKMYDSNVYTPETLNNKLQQSLAYNPSFIELTREQKPEGNLKRYEPGTTVELNFSDKLTYYLLGLSAFDANLNAQTTKEELIVSIQRLIEFCDHRSQGDPVVLPLIGSGRSRTNIELPDLLRYLVEAFAINKDKINCNFHIVIWKGDKDKISIKNL
jgi:hypothetical protein